MSELRSFKVDFVSLIIHLMHSVLLIKGKPEKNPNKKGPLQNNELAIKEPI